MNPSDAPEEYLDLNDRYGLANTRGRVIERVFIIALALSLITWLFWSANYHSDPQIKADLISFKAVSEKSIGINFQIIRREPGQSIECRLVAVDIDKYVVGEISYRIPAGKKRELISALIPTRSYAVSASVSRCTATS